MGTAAVPALIQAAGDRDEDVRIRVFAALGRVWPTDGRILSPLIAAAEDPADNVREWAVGVLGSLAATPDAVIPALVKALSDRDAWVRHAAGHQLGRVRPTEKVLPALLDVLEHGEPRARAQAAYTLGDLGSDSAAKSVPALTRALKDENETVRRAAAEARKSLGAPAATIVDPE